MAKTPQRLRGRLVAVGSSIALFVGVLVGIAGASAQEPSVPGTPELFNLQHVFNFNPNDHDPDRSPSVGSDLEFFTHTVPLRNYETGALVDEEGNELPSRAKPVMAQRDFAVVGSYQRGGYVFDITDPEHPQFVTQVTCRQDRNDVGIKKFTDPKTGETRVVLALTQQAGNPCGGVGVRINSPTDLAGFRTGTQWAGTSPVADQTADLVYAGTGCSSAQYADVDVQGKIALVDKFTNSDGVGDCPTFTFKQKMDAAEQAGALGLVQVDNNNAPSGGNAIESGIPGMEILNRDGVPIRDRVLAGTAVNATLTDGPTDGRLIGSGSGGIGVFDITDPYEWRAMYNLRTGGGGVHNFAFHPTKPYGYVSNGALPGLINQLPIIDFSNLDEPVVLPGPATEGGVHDVEFSLDGRRAYAASENNYRIYDTADPASPVLLSRTPNVGSYAHGVFPTSDLDLMVTNNESLVLGGFLVGGTGVCPGEGLASYDIAGDNERQPVGPLGYYVPNVAGSAGTRPCTSHFGRFAPGTKLMSIGWYIAGARVVDWSNPSSPVEVAGAVMPGTNTWAAKFYKGPYLYAGDLGRGFDVFRWSGDGPAPWVAEADLAITKTASASKMNAGSPLTYTLEVTNGGPREASGVIVRDRLPGGAAFNGASASQGSCAESGGEVTCTLGRLTNGAGATVTIDVTAPSRPGAMTNTASVTGHLVDPDTSDNTATATTRVTGPPAEATSAIEPGCVEEWCRIQPGALLGDADSGFCTMGFLFRDQGTGRLLMSTAAHCTDALGERLHAEQAEETFDMQPEAFGTVVFRDEGLDFALIQIHEGRESDVSAAVRVLTGPTRVSTPDDTAFGDEVRYYGYGFTFDLTPELRPRTGVLTKHTEREFQSNSAGMFGDSGAAVLHESGTALGLISRFNVLEDGVSVDLGPTVQGMLAFLAENGWNVSLMQAAFSATPLVPVP